MRQTASPIASCSYSPQPASRAVLRSRRTCVSCRALLKPADGLKVTWDQTSDEVRVRVPVAESVRGRDVAFEVHPTRLSVKVSGQPLLQGGLEDAGEIDVSTCFWVMDGDGEGRHIAITLSKKTMGYMSWDALLESDRPDMSVTQRTFLEFSSEGRVLGKVALGLYGNVVPRTVENFRALCTGEKGMAQAQGSDGKPLHYKGAPMHRIIPGFMAQGGDFVMGNGTGGESIYGEKFEDEGFRLRHDGAGVLAMANSGPNTNGSQFYITYAPQPHLDGKHVVFGRVEAGMEVMRRLEAMGSSAGKAQAVISVSDCGQLALGEAALDELDAFNRKLALDAPLSA